VTQLGIGGTARPVAVGLPSYGEAEGSGADGATGPAGLVATRESLWLAVGGPGTLTPFVQTLRHDGAVLRVDLATGAVAQVADLVAHERAHDPDGLGANANPYGLARAPDGVLYVADAGANALLRVDPASGRVSTAAVFEGLPAPEANPGRQGRRELDPVPTGVAVGFDGRVYVSLLSGAPHPPGAAKVVRLREDGRVEDVATGLTAAAGLAVAPDGLLYVTELFTEDVRGPAGAASGRISRLRLDGRREVVAEGLPYPNGLAFDRAGHLFATVESPGVAGHLLRCERLVV
jgi:sugar lactone lactonase YvrE